MHAHSCGKLKSVHASKDYYAAAIPSCLTLYGMSARIFALLFGAATASSHFVK